MLIDGIYYLYDEDDLIPGWKEPFRSINFIINAPPQQFIVEYHDGEKWLPFEPKGEE
jgi:hypothetical protein